MKLTSRHRQYLQLLRAGAWVKAGLLPHSPRVVQMLRDRGWIEQRGEGVDLSYRITERGLEAKRVPVPIER